ncbi:MAG: methanogenesis marker 3 protein [Methanomassiliicoccales archaeon]
MIIKVNGETIEAKEGSSLRDVLRGRPYRKGYLVAVIRSAELVQKETSEFEISTTKGSMVLRLNDSYFAGVFRKVIGHIAGKGVRWRTSKVLAVGAFPTDIEVVRGVHHYGRYDCFFTIGGFDNRTTYVMIGKMDHDGEYGAEGGVFGKITIGRHVLRDLDEGDKILGVKPVVLEMSAKDAFVTENLKMKIDNGMAIESYVGVKLNQNSPVNCEHFLVVTEGGTLPVTDRTETYVACSENMDVSLVPETISVRDEDMVTVRHEGGGMGRIYLYKVRRQVAPTHSNIGIVTAGKELLRLVPEGKSVTLVPNPARVMSIGMTQSAAQRFLEARGLVQVRKGEAGDDAIVVEQEPELTVEALATKEVETFGVRPERLNDWTLDDGRAPRTAHYIRKMTGLDHKPIGTMKVHFTYPDMPLVTFEGNPKEALDLVPEGQFGKESKRGDLAVTNMSRPNRGLIGLRLQTSDEFGPTGEERYGTNIAGQVVSDVDRLTKDLKDGDVVYVREVKTGKKAKGAKRGK